MILNLYDVSCFLTCTALQRSIFKNFVMCNSQTKFTENLKCWHVLKVYQCSFKFFTKHFFCKFIFKLIICLVLSSMPVSSQKLAIDQFINISLTTVLTHQPKRYGKHKYLCKSLNNQTVNDLIKINMKALITSSIDVTSHHFHK